MKLKKVHFGFSLIELLVVVSIICLLLALIMPTLKNARDLAYTAKCASNIRQVAMAGQMYAGENRGYLPLDLTLINGAWQDANFNWMYDATFAQAPKVARPGWFAFYLSGPGSKVKYPEVTYCPVTGRINEGAQAAGGNSLDHTSGKYGSVYKAMGGDGAGNPNFSYGLNRYVTGILTGNGVPSKLISGLPSPGKTVLWIETCYGGKIYDDSQTSGPHRFGKPDGPTGALAGTQWTGYGNFIFADMHLELLKVPNQIPSDNYNVFWSK